MRPCPSGAGVKSRGHIVAETRRAMAVLALLTGLLTCSTASATDVVIEAPNVVAISPRLVTSGQPSAEALASLAAQGFGAVIYLAPPTVSDAVAGEAEIVRRQGLEFINIPIGFGKPTEADFQSFVAAMERLRDRKVLVHCQVNMRASSMTFLYRAIVLHEKPELAYESVARVWSPEGPWKSLMVSQLRKAGIQFEPY
ncbi:phosphotyrosine protein phosphatase [Rugamonas sp. FT29W]|uniref:Phosphotyrosine protein phosphatase n=2 Tax=Rugamonas aquatica TaxID=2743357 RepID=A0A6A7MUP0_9BURK|nr:phosphotyrosine protein phosphatase [Rugamonas aquatica]